MPSTVDNFYKNIEIEFDNSRHKPWVGWGIVDQLMATNFKEIQNLRILDLGCGNSRFYKFITTKFTNKTFNYTGIDQNAYFLNKSREQFPSNTYFDADIFTDFESNIKNEKFDIVAAFGISHHIPLNIDLGTIIKKYFDFVDKNGILVISFWKTSKIIEGGFLGWGNTKFKRSYRKFEKSEIEESANLLGLKYEVNFIPESEKNGNYYLVIYNII